MFALFLVVVMLAAAGLAVDTLRAERERVRLQATLDRAVLAAGDDQQGLDPEAVVRDYVERAGLAHMLGTVEVTDEPDRRIVEASASRDMTTLLMHLAGVDTLRVAALAAAQDGAAHTEVSLVLDASGSMMEHGRPENLRLAATEFVRTVMPEQAAPDDENIVTISLVPYNNTVNLGPDLFELYNVDRIHNYSDCIRPDHDNFETTALPPTQELHQYAHFNQQELEGNEAYSDGRPRVIANPVCRRRPESGERDALQLIPASSDPDQLVDAIDAMMGALDMGTGIDAGMRWGVAMLDPETRPIVNTLINRGLTGAAAADRPLAYGRDDAIKVVVLMTDGLVSRPGDLRAPFRQTYSNVWYDEVTRRYSVLLRGNRTATYPYEASSTPAPDSVRSSSGEVCPDGPTPEPDGITRFTNARVDDRCAPVWYWVRDYEPKDDAILRDDDRNSNGGYIRGREGMFRDHPYTPYADAAQQSSSRNRWDLFGGNLRRLTYPELFDAFSRSDVKRFMYLWPDHRGWLSDDERTTYHDPKFTSHSVEGVNDRILALCRAAKAAGIYVYTIGFEVDKVDDQPREADQVAEARRLLSGCASSPAHFFEAEATEISEVFGEIARRLAQLRLTR